MRRKAWIHLYMSGLDLPTGGPPCPIFSLGSGQNTPQSSTDLPVMACNVLEYRELELNFSWCRQWDWFGVERARPALETMIHCTISAATMSPHLDERASIGMKINNLHPKW